jgi:hypothetical protein
MAPRDRYGDVMNTFRPQVSPLPAIDREVWTIRLFDAASGQGAVVIIDAFDGSVLQSSAFIT